MFTQMGAQSDSCNLLEHKLDSSDSSVPAMCHAVITP
jgi:hypothetical protein